MELTRLTVTGPWSVLERVAEAWFESGAAGVVEGDSSISVYAQGPDELSRLLASANLVLGRAHREGHHLRHPTLEIVGDDWQTTWTAELAPVPIAEEWVLRPTHRAPAPRGERTLWFEPRASFGSGEHSSTQLAAAALAELARTRRPSEESRTIGSEGGMRLLDVGAGNGVLSFVALSAGFEQAVAVDIDPAAVESCARNAALNGLQERCRVTLGSADSVAETFPVVVANIIAPVLSELAPALRERLHEGGTLVLAGLLTEDSDALVERFQKLGLTLIERRNQEDWGLLMLQAP